MVSHISEVWREEGLRYALGADILRLLSERDVTDVLLNEDGRLWADRLGVGRTNSGFRMSPTDADYALRMLASRLGAPVTRKRPLVCSDLATGERVAATIPPTTSAPTFAIRKPPAMTFDQTDFGETTRRNEQLNETARERRVGGYQRRDRGSPQHPDRRRHWQRQDIAALDHAQAPHCACRSLSRYRGHKGNPDRRPRDCVRFLTSDDADMRRLVEHALRYRPDRLIIGEIRNGKAAVEVLNALNSDHPGSVSTIHADSARHALRRLEQLCLQGCGERQSEAIVDNRLRRLLPTQSG